MPRVDFSSTRPKPWLDGNQVHALFKQDKVWIDKDLTTWKIEELGDRHLGHLLPFVARNYWRFREYTMLSALLDPIEGGWFGGVSSGEKELEFLPSKVEDTPLFKALTGELETRENEKMFDGIGPVVV